MDTAFIENDKFPVDGSLSALYPDTDRKNFVAGFICGEFFTEDETEKLDSYNQEIEPEPGCHRDEYKLLFLFNRPERLVFLDGSKLKAERVHLIPELARNDRSCSKKLRRVIGKYMKEDPAFAAQLGSAWESNIIKRRIYDWKTRYGITISENEYRLLEKLAEGEADNMLPLIPDYDEQNVAHWLFLNVAAKNAAVRVFERMFAPFNNKEVFVLFPDYYHRAKPAGYGGGGDELDRFLSTPEQDLRLFRDYLQRQIKQSGGEEKPLLIRTLFPMLHKAAPDGFRIAGLIRDLIRQDPRFGAVIAKEAARFPVKVFLRADGFIACNAGNMGETELAVFQKYCELIQPEDGEEVLLLLKFWYRFIVCQDISIIKSNLLRDFPFLDAFVLPYINDDLFRKGLLAIPRDDPEEQSDFFGFFYRQAENETEGTDKFGTFLELYLWFPEAVMNFISSSPGREERIVDRCGRLLGKFRDDPDNPELFGMAVSALWLLSSFRPYWKGLNPFLNAFRNSRAVLLEGNLAPKIDTLAFWWLRQASMLSLGRKIDEKRARDLRINESRHDFRYLSYHAVSVGNGAAD